MYNKETWSNSYSVFPPLKLSWEIHSHPSKCTLYHYYYYHHYYIVKHIRFTRHGSNLYITSVTVTAPIIVINLHQYVLYEAIKITVIISYHYFIVI
jgi:hypothetical protein